MAKRGSSGLSLIVGIDKPSGMSSHDVVNCCRRIFCERRVGHTGTLDPAATGAMAVCVGPATRLDAYIAGHRKTYEFDIVFGAATDTDDAQGVVIERLSVPDSVRDAAFAARFIADLVGTHNQIPPAYSAVKVNGRKSYDAARKGTIINLKPREVQIYDACLLGVDDAEDDASYVWHCRATVSGGTYIRSIARDVGHALKTCAHVGALRRTASGLLDSSACVSLEALEKHPFDYCLDPVKLLNIRFTFARDALEQDVLCGRPLDADACELFIYEATTAFSLCSCSSGVCKTTQPAFDGELIAVVCNNTLAALYAFDAESGLFKSKCGFSVGVKRGSNIS